VHPLALERFCEQILAEPEVRALSSDVDISEIVRQRDRESDGANGKKANCLPVVFCATCPDSCPL